MTTKNGIDISGNYVVYHKLYAFFIYNIIFVRCGVINRKQRGKKINTKPPAASNSNISRNVEPI